MEDTPAPPAPGTGPSRPTATRVVSGLPRGRHGRLYAENTALVGLALSRFPFLAGDRREDAYAAGLLGLWRAAQRYDPSRGFAFSSYATDTIRGHVLHHLSRERRQNRLPSVSLETPIGDGGEADLADVIADPQAERPGEALETRAGFEARLAGLPERQRELITAVYADEEPLSAVASAWGVSKARAGQIPLQALGRLRAGA